MGKTFVVAKREYLERVRGRWFAIATVFGPLLFGALLILPEVLGSRTAASRDVADVAILDATGTDVGQRLGDRLRGATGDTTLARVVRVAPAGLAAAESTATRAVTARELQGYFVLDAATLAGLSARYAGRNATSGADMDELRTAVRNTVLAYRLERSGISTAEVRSLTETRLALETERLTAQGRGGSGTGNVMFGIAVAMLLYLAIFIYGIAVLRGVQEEKQTRVAEVVVSSVSSDALLAGKVLGIGGMGLTQLVIWAVAAVAFFLQRERVLAAFGVDAATLPLPQVSVGAGALLLLFFLLGYVLYAALFAAVGAIVNSEQEAQQAALPVTILLVASVMFLQPVLQNPNSATALAVSWIPFTAPVMMPLRMALTSVPPLELALVLLGIAGTCVAVIWLAARIYRVGLLMYGKRPTIGELVRWIRYAG